MAESGVAVTEGAGKTLHTWSRIIAAVTREDEFVIPGEFPLPTYSVLSSAVVTATANSHLLQIMAGASLNVRIRRIRIMEATPPAAVSTQVLQLFRLTTAGTGGTVITPRPYETGDTVGATAMTLPTVKGTEGVQLREHIIWMGTAAIPTALPYVEWRQEPNAKPIIIPAGATNGIAIKNPVGLAAATVYIEVEFVETAYL